MPEEIVMIVQGVYEGARSQKKQCVINSHKGLNPNLLDSDCGCFGLRDNN